MIEKLHEAKFYGLTTDEETDISNKALLIIYLTFLEKSGPGIKFMDII